ncbi:LysR family transcriptional regulator ArgP [Janthinobacterium aquaticum]|uniref:LysR family transcriptional regulator ArgP n=1 Tax=Janthinobacterium sp. FT58W TaxID=2654254 RepID=UPI001265979A|nr:LysR family transcriptional regulator ArgP [Janthinobacterium sp. FT58W]KAB8041543.1 ArgP/LysG family DNA-binding transcriptional regulator [Janthinobacterium sp. FT58W]
MNAIHILFARLIMWDYRGLAALTAIVEEGNFERAAAALSISQPAVSHRLRALEEWAGELLVIRSQPPQATVRGQGLIAHFRKVKLLESSMEIESKAHSSLLRVAIAVNADSAATWLLQALVPLLAAPACLVDIRIDDQDETLRYLREGQVIGCVTSSGDAVAGTTVQALGVMSYLCVATPEFVRRWFPDGVTASATAVAPALAYNRSDRLHERYLEQARLPPDVPKNFFPSAEGFVSFIKAGFGYGMVPAIQVRHELESGSLVELAPRESLSVPLYWHQWNIQTPVTRTLNMAIVDAAQRLLA